jgi:hypothetical protein
VCFGTGSALNLNLNGFCFRTKKFANNIPDADPQSNKSLDQDPHVMKVEPKQLVKFKPKMH